MEKVIKDPLYGYVYIQKDIINKLIDTKEFQRLRRIKQLSGVSMVFHIAEHTRFSHGLGAYEIARQVIEKVTDIRNALSDYEQIVLLCSALLHDLGHGPYSHSFEKIFGINHEEMTVKIILGNTEVNRILKEYDPNLPLDISSVINHEGKFLMIESLVSSQLDVDRMDYLKRDAYFTGAVFGAIDIEKLLRGLTVRNNQICFKASSVPSIEGYLMSRYHMYYQVYFHMGARNFEILLNQIYKRIKFLIDNEYQFEARLDMLERLLSNKDDLEAYLELDDVYINGCIKQFKYEKDMELSNLCERLLDRKLFKSVNEEFASKEELEEISKYKDNPNYYYDVDILSKSAYDYITSEGQIKIVLPNEKVVSLIDYSPIVKAFSQCCKKELKYIFYDEVKNV